MPTLDADFVGRSVPEATQMLPAIHGLDLCPTACSDAFGNQSILTSSVNRHMLERSGKYTASASFGLIGQATLLEKSDKLKPYMLKGTLSKSYQVGKLLRKCKDDKINIESALHDLIGSKKLF